MGASGGVWGAWADLPVSWAGRGVLVVAGSPPSTLLDIMCIIGGAGMPVGKGFSRPERVLGVLEGASGPWLAAGNRR